MKKRIDGRGIAGRKRNDGVDFYPTPEWATEALMVREKFEGEIWEPACGNGRMSRVLEKYNEVYSSELRNNGYGKTGIDFFSKFKIVDNIVTNPPYYCAKKFVERAKSLANKKVAMFLKLTFLESINRYKFFSDKEFPLKKVWIFCRRVQLYKEGEVKPKNSGMIAFAWYIWDKNYKGKPTLGWIND